MAVFGLLPPLLFWKRSAMPQKLHGSRKPGPPSGPARWGRDLQATPACANWGKAASQPRSGAPGFGRTFAILKPEGAD